MSRCPSTDDRAARAAGYPATGQPPPRARAFDLNGSEPQSFAVYLTSPPEHATPLYSVVADYGWAQRILCSGCYIQDANDVARCLGTYLGRPYSLASRSTTRTSRP